MRLFGKLDGVLDALDIGPLLIPPFVQRRFAGYNIYLGIGDVEGIDWQTPVAFAPAETRQATLVQALPPGQRFVVAARSVRTGGVEDGNTHVLTYVEADDAGDLLPPPLARPADLTVEVLATGEALLGFSYLSPPGFAPAEGFQVLSDCGTGVLDLEDPIQTIDEVAADQTDFEVALPRPETSLRLAVRAQGGGRPGPLSSIARLLLPAPPAPARPL